MFAGRRSTATFSTLTYHRLQYRLSYQTKRFSSRAPYWQFIIWLRQFLMVAVTFLPWMMGMRELAHGHVLRGNLAR